MKVVSGGEKSRIGADLKHTSGGVEVDSCLVNPNGVGFPLLLAFWEQYGVFHEGMQQCFGNGVLSVIVSSESHA